MEKTPNEFDVHRFGQAKTATELVRRLLAGETCTVCLNAVGKGAMKNARSIAKKVQEQLHGYRHGTDVGEDDGKTPKVWSIAITERLAKLRPEDDGNNDDDDSEKKGETVAISIDLKASAVRSDVPLPQPPPVVASQQSNINKPKSSKRKNMNKDKGTAAASAKPSKTATRPPRRSHGPPPHEDDVASNIELADSEHCPDAEEICVDEDRALQAARSLNERGKDGGGPKTDLRQSWGIECRRKRPFPVLAIPRGQRDNGAAWPQLRVFVPRSSLGHVKFSGLVRCIKKGLGLTHLNPEEIMLWKDAKGAKPIDKQKDVIPEAVFYAIAPESLAKRKSPKAEYFHRPMALALWLAMGMGRVSQMPRVLPPFAEMCHSLLYRSIDVAICMRYFWSSDLCCQGIVRVSSQVTVKQFFHDLHAAPFHRTAPGEMCAVMNDYNDDMGYHQRTVDDTDDNGFTGSDIDAEDGDDKVADAGGLNAARKKKRRPAWQRRREAAMQSSNEPLSKFLIPAPRSPPPEEPIVKFGEEPWPYDRVSVHRQTAGGTDREVSLSACALGLYPKRKKNSKSHKQDPEIRERIRTCSAVIVSRSDAPDDMGYDTYDEFTDLGEDDLVA